MTYDRRAIMHEAWEIVRRFVRKQDTRSIRQLLSHALKQAWYRAHVNLQIAHQAELRRNTQAQLERTSVESLRAELLTLENRTFLGHSGLERLSAVQNALRVAKAREAQILPIAA